MKIRNKINLAYIIFFSIILVSFSVGIIYLSDRSIKKEVLAHIETSAGFKEENIVNLLMHQKEVIDIVADSTVVKDLLRKTKNGQERTVEVFINDIMLSFHEIDNISVLDNSGEVISSTKQSDILEGVKDVVGLADKLKAGKYKYHITYQEDGIEIELLSPIYSGGEKIGFTVADISLDSFYDVLTDRIGWGETGEVYLINKDKKLVSPSRFFDGRILTQEVDTKNADNCLERVQAGIVDESSKGSLLAEVFSDYRGVPVLGINYYIPEMEWCLLAEYDVEEVLAARYDMYKYFAVYIFLAIFLMFIFSYFISRRMTRSIEVLNNGIARLEKGDLDESIEIKTKDEIGKLAKSFVGMAESVKKAKKNIDDKVVEQTVRIMAQQREIEQQQKATLNILKDVEMEKSKATVEKEKVDAILQSIGDGVFVVDMNLEITMFNTAAANITRYTRFEALGTNYEKIMHFLYEDTKESNNKFIGEAIESGTTKHVEKSTVMIRNDNSVVSIDVTASPLKNKEKDVVGCVVVFRDVSKERAIDKAKTEFVSLASHQLRTPLSSINWYTEMLLSGDAGEINDEQKTFLDEIHAGNQRMVDLVNALLNVSRLELGTFVVEPEPVDILDIANSSIKELKAKIIERNINLTKKFDEGIPEIMLDKKLIFIVFQNLLSNAVKYNKDNGEVEVIIKKSEKDVEIQIRDTGMGIPSEQQDKIFSKLFRADNVKQADVEGTGLGMYIIKSIIDQGGGKIWFESQEGIGSIFL